jgi:hypothetical protein
MKPHKGERGGYNFGELNLFNTSTLCSLWLILLHYHILKGDKINEKNFPRHIFSFISVS